MLNTIEKLAGPGMKFMRQLNLSVKFATISIAFLVPITVTLYAMVGYSNANIEFASDELVGANYLHLAHEQLRASTRTSANWSTLKEQTTRDGDVLKLATKISALPANPTTEQWTNFYADIGDSSKLILDPDLDSFYTMSLTLDVGPKLVNALQQLTRAQQSGDRSVLYAHSTISNLATSLRQARERAVNANGELARAMDLNPWNEAEIKLERAIDALATDPTSTAHVELTREVIDKTLDIMDRSVATLTTLLQTRVDRDRSKRNGLVILTIVCLALATYLLTSFYFCDQRGFDAIKTRMDKLATGDLTVNYPARGRDEIGILINAFNDSRAQLQVLVNNIRVAADNISTAGREISSANMDLAQRSSAQVVVIDETASRVRQVTEKVQANLEAASNANLIAREASDAASTGKTVVDSVVTTMDTMSSSSSRIGAIIDTINEIAFQTNLLALNAAVEAARAGEQGRGFAVVAGEVRNLAQRCATAANEITTLIKASVNDVHRGVGQVGNAGKSMQEILDTVGTVSEIMAEMTDASKAQIQAIKGIDSAVSKINDDAQQNAALVEETASAAELLREQVNTLVESVNHFTMGTESDHNDHSLHTPQQVYHPTLASGHTRRAA